MCGRRNGHARFVRRDHEHPESRAEPNARHVAYEFGGHIANGVGIAVTEHDAQRDAREPVAIIVTVELDYRLAELAYVHQQSDDGRLLRQQRFSDVHRLRKRHLIVHSRVEQHGVCDRRRIAVNAGPVRRHADVER